MSKRLTWRLGIIAVCILGALLYLVPSLSKNLPPWWSSFLPTEKVHLGLDLQGGMHLVLEVEAIKAVESNIERVVEELKHDLRKNRFRYQDLKRIGTDGMALTLLREDDRSPFREMFEANYPDFELKELPGQPGKPTIELVLRHKAREHIM